MSLSEQCKTDLGNIMHRIRVVADNMKTAAWAEQREDNEGLSAMLNNDAMERWIIAGKVADFLTCAKEIVYRNQLPESTMVQGNMKDMPMLAKMDSDTITVLDGMVKTAFARGSASTGSFMVHIRNCYQKEVAEVANVLGELKTLSESPDKSGLILYDKWLMEEYSHKYREYKIC